MFYFFQSKMFYKFKSPKDLLEDFIRLLSLKSNKYVFSSIFIQGYLLGDIAKLIEWKSFNLFTLPFSLHH